MIDHSELKHLDLGDFIDWVWALKAERDQLKSDIERLKGGYFCREIGEGEWRPCSKEEYERYSKYPEMDTKTSQPAPVSVVLPERCDLSKKMFDEMSPSERDISFKDIGWNACLDKVKELNQ